MARQVPYRKFKSIVEADGFVFNGGAYKNGLLVYNNTGSAIAANKVVAISGFNTTKKLPQIVLADVTLAGHNDLYITTAAISIGAKAHVFKGFLSPATLNTNSFASAGDLVYPTGSAGAFTINTSATFASANTASADPIGFVVVKSATVGQILWSVQPPKRNPASLSARIRTSTANVNTGATLIPAPGAGYALRLVDALMISVGGAAATATTVDIKGTQSSSVVKLVAFGQANLTQSTVLRPGVTGATVLADGASFAVLDANTAITIGSTTNNLATSTNIDVIIDFAVDLA